MKNDKLLSIYVVSHKKIEKEIKKEGYHYIGVGPNKDSLSFEYRDDKGDNIADKNANYCELTAQYWIWKNSESQYVGLEHYRRFFYHPYRSVFSNVLYSKDEFLKLLKKYDILVSKKERTFYSGKGTVYEHYCYFQHKKDMDEVREIIKEKYPYYLNAFDEVMKSTKCSLYNMMITSKKIYDEYSSFLFGVLFELEKRVDISDYDAYQKRIYGFIGERLVNVFLLAHPEYSYKGLPVLNLDDKQPIFLRFCKNVIKTILWKLGLYDAVKRNHKS